MFMATCTRYIAALTSSMAVGYGLVQLSPYVLQAAQRGNPPVTVDFRAVTDDGQPILDLKAADVSLKVDGKSRDVRALKLVQRTTAAMLSRVTAPFTTNVTGESGRDLILLVDDDSISPGREAIIRDAASQLMAMHGTGDRVALLGVRPGGLSIALTSDAGKVRAGLAAMVGQARTGETPADVSCRTRVALQTIRGVFASHARETPPTVVFFSSGISPPVTAMRTTLGVQPTLCTVEPAHYEEVATAATQSRANFFAVLVVDGTNSGASSDMMAGMESLAGVTGGETMRLAGSAELPMGRIARDASTYYVASFDAEAGERSGSSHRIEVRVARDRVKVYAKPGIFIAKAQPSATPRDMLRTATVYRDLPLRAAAYASRGADEKAGLKIVALFEAAEPSTTLSAAMVGLYDDKGTLKANWTAQPAELARPLVLAALVAPAGHYRMRVAATDSSGRSGSVDVDVPLELKPIASLRTSALMLGVPLGGAFAPRLQFGADAAAAGALEIYGVPKGATLAVQLELAESEHGPALANTPASLAPGPGEDGRTAYGGFTIATLKPGDYVLRAVVSVDGKEAGRATATVRKVLP